jgi:hypothetical protein
MSEQSPRNPSESDAYLLFDIPEQLHFAQDFSDYLVGDEDYVLLSAEDRLAHLPHHAHVFIHRAVEQFPDGVRQRPPSG